MQWRPRIGLGVCSLSVATLPCMAKLSLQVQLLSSCGLMDARHLQGQCVFPLNGQMCSLGLNCVVNLNALLYAKLLMRCQNQHAFVKCGSAQILCRVRALPTHWMLSFLHALLNVFHAHIGPKLMHHMGQQGVLISPLSDEPAAAAAALVALPRQCWCCIGQSLPT